MRIDRIVAEMKLGDPCTVATLADRFGVSGRTIARDLDLLRAQSLPIEAERGRGGGVRLDPHWGVGRVALSYAEAIDLLIGIDVAEKMGSPLFLANLGSVRRQLVASFSPKRRSEVARLKSRIQIGFTASTHVQATVNQPPRRVVQALHQGFIDRETLSIRYAREDGTVSEREIEPHYLLLKYPVWYVIAADHLRKEPRTFRCDRILSARRTGTRFRLRPKEAFAQSLVAEDLGL